MDFHSDLFQWAGVWLAWLPHQFADLWRLLPCLAIGLTVRRSGIATALAASLGIVVEIVEQALRGGADAHWHLLQWSSGALAGVVMLWVVRGLARASGHRGRAFTSASPRATGGSGPATRRATAAHP